MSAHKKNTKFCWVSGIKDAIFNLSIYGHKKSILNYSGAVKGETTIYGIVQNAVGEKRPRATLKINNEYTISIDVRKDIAKKLATHLYDEAGLLGVAKWDKNTYRILDFNISSIVALEDKSINETFEELGALLGEHMKRCDMRSESCLSDIHGCEACKKMK